MPFFIHFFPTALFYDVRAAAGAHRLANRAAHSQQFAFDKPLVI
jgi:hypothetical protein